MYVFIPCLAQTLAQPDIFMLLEKKKDACRITTTICRPCRKIGDPASLLQPLLSDKYRYIDQEFLFFLGIASLQQRILPIRWSSQEAIRASEDVQGTPQIIFLRCPNAPFVESRHSVCMEKQPQVELPEDRTIAAAALLPTPLSLQSKDLQCLSSLIWYLAQHVTCTSQDTPMRILSAPIPPAAKEEQGEESIGESMNMCLCMALRRGDNLERNLGTLEKHVDHSEISQDFLP